MTALSTAIGIAGNITGIAMYASPIFTFWRIFTKGSTESFSGAPYACALLSTLQWVYFGILRGPIARPLVSICSTGFALHFCFNSVFLRFASKSARVRQGILIALIFAYSAAMITLTMTLLASDLRIKLVGTFCVVTSACFNFSPLLILKRVIVTGSVEFMPFNLALFMSVNAATWCFFAFVTRDVILMVMKPRSSQLPMIFYILFHWFFSEDATYRWTIPWT